MSKRIPEGWSLQLLGKLTDVRSSNVDKKSDSSEISVRLCNYTDVYYHSQITSDIDFMLATAKQNEIDRFSLKKGDVIITKDSETPDDIAVSSFVSESLQEVVCGYHLTLLRPNPKLSNGEFLAHQFQLSEVQHYFYLLANGTTRFGLTAEVINKAPLVTPPLPEQQKIATILSSVDDVIEKTRAQIDKLKDLKTGMMQELLTKGIGHTEFKDSPVGKIPKSWEVVALGNTGRWKGGGTPSKANQSFWQGDIPWVSPKDMKSEFIKETEDSITDKAVMESSTNIVPAGSVLMVVRSGILKHTLPVAISLVDLAINQDMKALIVNEKFSALYIYQYLLANNRKVLQATLKAGNTVESLDFSDFSNYLIPFPSLEEQHEIASVIESIALKLRIKERLLKSHESLKKALMQDLLTGTVRVNVD